MDTTVDIEYQTSRHVVSEYPHGYGKQVHILTNPVLLQLINKVSNKDTEPQEIFNLVRWIYRLMLYECLPMVAPIKSSKIQSRMVEFTPRGAYQSLAFDLKQKFVTVALARAGIVPSQVCFEEVQTLLGYEAIWQDHFFCSRVINKEGQVTGAEIIGHKIGGSIQDKVILVPDPMGATGLTLDAVIEHYQDKVPGTPKCFLALNIIVSPEYIKRVTERYPNLIVFTGRLDRGVSKPEILNTSFGQNWDEESGLNEKQYIVPGAGGLGELLNNTEH